MTSSAPILEVRDLTVKFGTLLAVNEVSFAVRRGVITSVIGPNGAGKSTLFNLVSGAIDPQRHGAARRARRHRRAPRAARAPGPLPLVQITTSSRS